MAYGKLKERLLSFVDGDDKEDDSPGDFNAVRRFSTEIVEHRKPGRGRQVERVEFVLTLRPPAYQMMRISFDPKARITRVGGKDAPEYRVNGHVWRRAEKAFSRHLGMTHAGLFDLWNIALNEAISGEELSDGYRTRGFRGPQLLDAMRVHGPDFAAWGFITEEAASLDIAGNPGYRRLAEAGERARYDRIGFGKRRKERKVPAFTQETEEAVPRDECLSAIDVDSLVGSRIQPQVDRGAQGQADAALHGPRPGGQVGAWMVPGLGRRPRRHPQGARQVDRRSRGVRRMSRMKPITQDPGKRILPREPRMLPAPPTAVPPALRFMLDEEAREDGWRFYSFLSGLTWDGPDPAAWCEAHLVGKLAERWPYVARADEVLIGVE